MPTLIKSDNPDHKTTHKFHYVEKDFIIDVGHGHSQYAKENFNVKYAEQIWGTEGERELFVAENMVGPYLASKGKAVYDEENGTYVVYIPS